MSTTTDQTRGDAPRATGRGTHPVLRSTRAELLRLRKWPALWTTIGVELLLNVLFLYVFNFVSYRSGGAGGMSDGLPAESLLARMLPAAIPASAVQGMPMFGGALVLVLGALAAGSGYGWGTVKTVALQGPGRLAGLAGLLLALAVTVVGLVTSMFTMDVGLSLLIAATENQAVVWPGGLDLLQSFGSGVLIMGMWTLAGVLIGTLARGPALSVGLGLVWVLAIENLLRGVGALWSPMERFTDVLPGTAAGSLAGALGSTPLSEPGGTSGVLTTLTGSTATGLLTAYALAFLAATAGLVRRRDIT